MIDRHGLGVEGANHAIADNAHHVEGDYVLVLDDDDMLISADAVQDLKDAVVDSPDLVVFKADHGRLGVLPTYDVWQSTPQKARIGSCDFITRRDMFKLCANAWRVESCGDYEFLQAVWNRKPNVVWLDKVLAGVQRISFGAGE